MPAGRPLQAGDPTSVGAYRLVGRLGQGGQGVVYLGTAPDGTDVAIKVLGAEWAQDASFRQRFAREARAAQRVASFCTAQVLDAAFDVEQPYIVSEYVNGPSLKDEVDRNGPRSGAELHRLAVATATALVAVHEAGIVHRDFKPANVLLETQGPRVIDFGVAQTGDVTGVQTQSVLGTPGYMAPEQIDGGQVSPAMDVFAWGAVMVFAATGHGPFMGDSIPTVIHRVMSAPPALGDVAEPWRSITEHCLAKDPAQRPTSADLLMRLLGRRESTEPGPRPGASAGSAPQGSAVPPGHAAAYSIGHAAAPMPGHGAQVPAPAGSAAGATTAPDGPQGRGRRGSARKRLAVIGAALALVLVVGAGSYAAWATRSPDDPSGVAAGDQPSGAPPAAESPSASSSPSAEPSKSPTASPSSGAAHADVPAPEKPSKKPESDKDKPDEDKDEEKPEKVTFSSKFAGRWVGNGTFPNQTERSYNLVIEQGSQRASLTTSDNACTWNFELFRTNNKGGYDGSMTTGAGCGPHRGGGFWIDGGRLVVMLWGKEGQYKPHFFWLDRP